MSFVTNGGGFVTNPLTSVDRYMLLAHPAVADTLVLNEFAADGNGYKPSQVLGLLSTAERTLSSIVAVQASYKKLQWQDLAFVMSKAQADLFDSLLLAQSPAQPITLSDRIADPAAPVSKLVILLAPNGRTVYGTIKQYLVQFTALEV